MNTPIGKSTLGEMLPLFIVIGILFIIIMLCIKMVIKTSKIKANQKRRLNELKAQGLLIHTTLCHVNGLPIAENMLCEIRTFADRIEFKSGTTEIKLQRSKITDMCVKTDTEIQKQAVSSTGGAIVGGMMFGALGAAIGGRIKTKNVKTTTQYLIITYVGENSELKYIGFDSSNNLLAWKLVEEFRSLNTNSGIQIEL